MADGRQRPLSTLTVGDMVLGTAGEAGTRRYAPTRVLDVWRQAKAAHRLTLHDGTVLVASAEHRFLTDAGWTAVAGGRLDDPAAGGGAGGPGALTEERMLSGPGRFAPAERLYALAGQSVGPEPDLRVRGVQALDGAMELYDITTASGDFIAEGVVSHNCCARPTHRLPDRSLF